MQKIHRRKNQDILKEFICPQNCGKAYGSYAALYTHIKNKHPTAKPPQMKADHIKVKEYTRKSKTENTRIVNQRTESVDYDCKICKQRECRCDQAIRQSDLELNIMLLSDQTFIKFVYCIGQLQLKDKFMWTRNTQQPFMFLSKHALIQMAQQYNARYQNENNNQVQLSNKWLDYLSLGSKYWDRRYIKELYYAIFIIIAKQDSKQLQLFFKNHSNEGQDFQNITKCLQARPEEWNELVQLIKIL